MEAGKNVVRDAIVVWVNPTKGKILSTPKREINNDFGSCAIDSEVAKIAAKAVCSNALDIDDARLILDILGLINPQPGYYPFDSEESKLERRRESYERKRREKVIRDAKKSKLNATNEEIGEVDNIDDSFPPSWTKVFPHE